GQGKRRRGPLLAIKGDRHRWTCKTKTQCPEKRQAVQRQSLKPVDSPGFHGNESAKAQAQSVDKETIFSSFCLHPADVYLASVRGRWLAGSFVLPQAEGIIIGGTERNHCKSDVLPIGSEQSVGDLMDRAVPAGGCHRREPGPGRLQS